MNRTIALTTFDNPFDPIDQFNDWWRYDTDHGYNSCQYLARIAKTTDQFSENENAIEIERAIDEIIRLDPFGIYRKFVKEE
mgnify:FL=1|jgi:hypothetical protein